jgi:hypothetical protein
MAPVKARNTGMINTTFSTVRKVAANRDRTTTPPIPLPRDFILVRVIF